MSSKFRDLQRGVRITRAMDYAGLTVPEVARLLPADDNKPASRESRVKRWRVGGAITPKEVAALADICGVRVGYITAGDHMVKKPWSEWRQQFPARAAKVEAEMLEHARAHPLERFDRPATETLGGQVTIGSVLTLEELVECERVPLPRTPEQDDQIRKDLELTLALSRHH